LSILESIIMGAIQGITEFLPISSSAHLIIVPWFLKISEGNIDKLAYDVLLHAGTLFAIMLIYGKKFLNILLEGIKDLKQGMIKDSLISKIIIATCPAAIFGYLCKDFIEGYLRTPYITALMLFAVSILMIISERININKGEISYQVALLIGFAQAIALVPGTSRSGITITLGILLGLKRTQAVDFSFLLSIPIIFGTFLYELKHLHYQSDSIGVYVIGVASAFFFGALSLKFLIGYLKKHSLDIFAYYRIGIALLILLFSKY
jgi:undecaprenyl-diphosphatase